MNKSMRIALTAMFTLTVGSSWAQQSNEPFIPDADRPEAGKWIPVPPELTSGEFTYDFYWYQRGREARENEEISAQALSDESADLKDVFSEPLGLQLSYETTPEILKLAERATTDAHRANKKVKDVYKRTRPFAQFNDASLKPETDEEEAGTYSFPSGHSSRGWMYAFVLATIAPEKAESLFQRAHMYAKNRLICGHHWRTDIDASLMLSAGIFATIVSTAAFQEQMTKARQEYLNITTGVREMKASRLSADNGQTYTISGTPATDSSKGIIIKNGQKIVVK